MGTDQAAPQGGAPRLQGAPARKELITVVVEALRREVAREPVRGPFVFLTPYAEVLEVMQAVGPAAGRSSTWKFRWGSS